MEIQIRCHKVTEKMQCLIFDCLQNKRGLQKLSECEYSMNIGNNLCEINFFNPTYTCITQTFKINDISSIGQVRIMAKPKIRRIITTCNNIVSLYCSKLCEAQDFNPFQLVAQKSLPLQKSDNIIQMSSPINIQGCEGMLIYTKQEEYYMIIIKADRRDPLEIVSLKKINQPTGFMSWFTKSKVEVKQKREVSIYPFKIDSKNNFFKVLVLRDHLLQINMIQIVFEQGKPFTIKNINKLALPERIKSDGRIIKSIFQVSNEIEPRQAVLFLAVQTQQATSLFKLQMRLGQDLIVGIKTIKQNCGSLEMELALCKGNLYCKYVNPRGQSQIYKYQLQALSQLDEQHMSQIEPLKILNQSCCFSGDAVKLFLLSASNVFALEEKEPLDVQQEMHHELKEYNKFREGITQAYFKKTQRCLSNEDPVQIIELLRVKDRYIAQKTERKMQLLKKPSDQQVKAELAHEYQTDRMVIKILLFIFQSPHLPVLRQRLKGNSLTKHNALEMATIITSKQKLQQLLGKMLRERDEGLQLLFIDEVVGRLVDEYQGRQQLIIVREMVEKNILCLLELLCESEEGRDRQWFKQLLSNSIDLIDYNDHYYINLLRKGQYDFLKKLSLKHHIPAVFILLFCTHDYHGILQSQLQSFVQTFYEEESLLMFADHFFYRCKQVQLKHPDFMLRRIKVIVYGFKSCSEVVYEIVRKHFAGLAFFFAIMSKQLIQKTDDITKLATQCKDPQSSYILFSSISSRDGVQCLTAQLCKQLDTSYLSHQELIQSISSGKYQGKTIKKAVWEKFKRAANMEIAESDTLEKKIKFE